MFELRTYLFQVVVVHLNQFGLGDKIAHLHINLLDTCRHLGCNVVDHIGLHGSRKFNDPGHILRDDWGSSYGDLCLSDFLVFDQTRIRTEG